MPIVAVAIICTAAINYKMISNYTSMSNTRLATLVKLAIAQIETGITCAICELDLNDCTCYSSGGVTCDSGEEGQCFESETWFAFCLQCETEYVMFTACLYTGYSDDYCVSEDWSDCPNCA